MPSLSSLLRDKLSLTSSSTTDSQPIKTYYLAQSTSSSSSSSINHPSAPPLLPIPSPQPLPPSSLLFSLAHPPLESSPATAFFLTALPDPIGFLFHSSTFIRHHFSLSSSFPRQPRDKEWRHQLIELELKDEDGLAATSGGMITVSLRWVDGLRKEVDGGKRNIAQAVKELKGVLLHELVHTIQHDAQSTTPGWLIESIADYLRLLAALDPPHWRKPGQGRSERGWEEAYDSGARFLSWLTGTDSATSPSELNRERTNYPPTATGITPPRATQYPYERQSEHEGAGAGNGVKGGKGERRGPFPDLVKVLDARMRAEKWDDVWWEEMCGAKLDVLWKEYLEWYA